MAGDDLTAEESPQSEEVDKGEQNVADDTGGSAAGSDAYVNAEVPVVSSDEESKGNDCPPCKGGAPAWMATFADMATLLMAFFVLLLSFAETEVPKFKQVAGSLKQAFGIEKIVPKVTIPMARSLLVEDFTPAVAERTVQDIKQQRSDFVRGDFIEKKTEEGLSNEVTQSDFELVQEALENELNLGLADVRIESGEIKVTLLSDSMGGGAPSSEGKGKGAFLPQDVLDAVAKVSDLKAEIDSDVGIHLMDRASGALDGASASQFNNRPSPNGGGLSKYQTLRADLSDEIAAGLAEVEKDGDKIIIRLANQGSFTSGSASLRPSFAPTLTRLGNSLAAFDGSVMVEGHTDNVPVAFSDRFKSNWDLSAGRAAAIADFLLVGTGLEPGSVQVAGFADTRPIASNDSALGRSRNRRIEVIVDDT